MLTLFKQHPALRLLSVLLFSLLFAPQIWAAGSTTVVISQLYTAGGNSGATYNADYVELHNISSTPQTLTGWSLQYSSATGTTAAASVISIPGTVTIPAGGYYLVQGTAGSTGAALPVTADVTLSGLAMGASGGRIYLTNSSTAIAVGNLCTPGAVDWVGYGNAVCFEGTKAAPTPTTTVASIRAGNGCTDTDDNGADFATGTPAPHNSSSAITSCSTGPASLSVAGSANPSSVYQNATTLLTAAVTPGTGSTGITVAANLSAFGGSSTQPMFDDATHGDATAGDGIYSYLLAVPTSAPLGANTIVATAADAQAHTATANIAVTVLAPVTLVPIHTIQGSVAGTAAYNGQTVMTSGIITGVKVNGFYLQAKDADADSDPSTPEGIFVHTGTGLVPGSATVGTAMQVTGTVTLFPTAGPLPGTELDSPTAFTVLSTGNLLPNPITLTTSNPSPSGGFAQLQRYQSMRVAVPSFTVTGPTEGVLTETAETYVSTGQFWGTVTGTSRPVREPGLEILDPLTASEPSTIPRFDDNPELFEVDSLALVPTPGPLDLATGTTLTNLSGIMDLSSGTTLFLIDAATRPTVTGGLTVVPVPAPNAGEITIGDQNFERFYTTARNATGATIITQAAYDLRKAKASLAIRNVMRMPDIIAMEEIEDIATLQDLAAKVSTDAIAASQPDPHYAAYLVQGNDTSGINVAFLVKPATVNVVDVTQFGKATTFTQPSTGNQAELNDRPPLVLHAGIKRTGTTDYPLTVIVNHLRSLNGVTDNTGSGQNTRAKREQQAEYLANLVQGYQAAGEHVIVVGDMNFFEFSDGIVDSAGIIKGTAAPASQVIVPGPSGLVTPNLVDVAPTNLATNTYSYSFVGNAQSIDHFFVTSNIASIVRTAPAHYNADFPAIYRNDSTRPEVGSDHDGIVGYIKIPGTTVLSITPTTLTFPSQVLSTTSTQTVTVTNNGTAPITVTTIVSSNANFTIPATPCGAQIVSGTPCVITVTFKPTATGPITGTLTLTDSDVTGTQTVTLNGTGAGIFSAVALTATPGGVFGSTINLSATVTGNAGATPTGTVNFLDGATVIKSAAALNTSGIATFSTTTLAVGTHSITAVYSGDASYPTSTSTASSVLITAPPVPDFTFTVANGSLVANSGARTASTVLHVAMVNGFTGTVSFACTGLPSGARCTFSPASLSATGDSTLTVGIDGAALHAPLDFGGTGTMLAFALLTLPFLARRKVRAALGKAGTLMALLLLAVGFAALTGCGGGGSSNSTPTGASTITVTATSGSVSHSGTFTLNVQ